MPTLKVMTWNVENLFRPPPAADAAVRDTYRRKLALLAATLGGIGPDIVALQEIGGPDALEDLQKAAGGTFGHAAISAFPDRRGIRVGFLSRLAIEQTEDIVDIPQLPVRIEELGPDGQGEPVRRMSRGALRVRIRKNGAVVELVTVPLKSKLLSFPAPGGGTRFEPRDETERAQ